MTADDIERGMARRLADAVEADAIAVERTLHDMGVGAAMEAAKVLADEHDGPSDSMGGRFCSCSNGAELRAALARVEVAIGKEG